MGEVFLFCLFLFLFFFFFVFLVSLVGEGFFFENYHLSTGFRGRVGAGWSLWNVGCKQDLSSSQACRLKLNFSPGGPLECQGGYLARPKIHVIRVVFQDQALYACTSFRGAKTCKIGKKGVFWVIWTNFGKDMTDKLRKMLAKTRI